MTPGDTFIEEEIPPVQRAIFPKALTNAYKAVRDLIKETPFLQCPPAEYACHGHLITWAVDFAVHQLIENGQWQCEGYDWPYFSKPTGRYLRIFTKRAVISVSQLCDSTQQPRYADFRSNARFDQQMTLFLLPGEKELSASDRQRLLLVHGHRQLNFIHFVMPNPEKNPAWLGCSPNILKEIHDVSTNLVPAEGPKEIDAPTIKEQLKKRLRDHGS
jgi:hypothetical protein